MVCIRAENPNQKDISPFRLQQISVLFESFFGHLCYFLTDVPPQPNSQSQYVTNKGQHLCEKKCFENKNKLNNYNEIINILIHWISKTSFAVVVFQDWFVRTSHLFYTHKDISQIQTRVKLNRVFFPR
jgi:hypothetical protein